ncbi:MAG TPA: sugar-binding protein [Propionicimonas sp.]
MRTHHLPDSRLGVRRPTRLVAALAAVTTTLVTLAVLPAAAPAAAADSGTVVLGDFESGTAPWFPVTTGAATATLGTTSDAPAGGSASARLQANVPSGTVEMARGVPSVNLQRLTLSVRSPQLTGLVLRLIDGTGQAHQQTLALTPGTQWQHLVVDQLAGGSQYSHWGGANDGVWHGPLKQISLLIDWFRVKPGPAATLDVDDVVAQGPPPPLAISPTTLGNAFTTGQVVSFGVRSAATSLSWTARDADGVVVATGSGTPAGLNDTISLGALGTGWYAVDVSAVQPDGSVVTGGTDVSVLPASALRESRIGAATHYGGPWALASLPLLGQAGLGFARDEAYWSAAETTKGTIAFPAKVDAYATALHANGVDFLDVLDYGNSLYFPYEAPATDADRAAFARYAAASVAHFGTAHTAYEMWNEWNLREPSGPAGATAQNYAALLATAAAQMKAVDPGATIVGPALAPMNDWQGWLDQFIAAGGLNDIAAFSTHPYDFTAEPEAFVAHVATLRQKLDAAGHPDMPIWFTEQGWYTTPNAPGVTPDVQARDLARAQLLALGEGVGRYTVYDFKDDGTTATDPENNFGMIRNENDARGAYAPKPAFQAEGVLTRQTAGRAVDQVLSLGSGSYGVAFGARDGEASTTRMEALWALTPQTWSVQATGPVTVSDLYGQQTVLRPDASGVVHVSVGVAPVYLTGEVGAVTTSSPFSLSVSNAVGGIAPTATWHVVNDGDSARTVTLTSDGRSVSTTVPAGTTTDVAADLAPASVGAHTWTAVVSEGGAPIGLLTASAQVVPALEIAGVHAQTATGADVLRLTVRNHADHTIRLDGVTDTIGGTSGTTLVGADVPGGGSTTQDVPIPAFGAWQATVTAGTATASAAGTVATATPVDVPFQSVAVDGVVDASVAALPAQYLGKDTVAMPGWAGPQDLGGKLWVTHDADRLYVTAQITDDVQSQPARGANIWQGDSLQIGSTPGWPGEARTPVGELGAALTDAGVVDVTRWLPVSGGTQGVTAAVKRDAASGTTTYEVAITWAALGVDPSDRLLASTIVVNDNDGSGRRGWASWGLGVAEAKDPTKFEPLRLMPPADGSAKVTANAHVVCTASGAQLLVNADNHDTLAADIRVTTPFGTASFAAVPPKGTVSRTFPVGASTVAAGSFVVDAEAISAAGIPSYRSRQVDYDAATCP